MNKEIEIPEGYEARIEGNKVILEPKESEDEKIRKWLIEMIEELRKANPTNAEHNGNCSEAIAYLERQKEQKPESCDCSRDEESYMNGIHHVLMNPEAYGLIKQKPASISYNHENDSKPAEWSEDWREEDIQTRFAFYTYKDDPSVLYLSNVFVEEASRNHGFGTRILMAAEKVAEVIGATTISLKVKQDSPANAWYRKNGYGYVTFEDGYDWLEKKLEYMKPYKQEWSEEDKLHLNNAILVAKKEWGVNSYTARFLESLRDNCKKCNNHWKPSEEQMEALKDAFRKDGGNEYRKVINSLYCDLQKLL